MKSLISMKYPVLLFPMLAMGISTAVAQEDECDCPCDLERTTVSADKTHARTVTGDAAHTATRAETAAREKAASRSAVPDSNYLQSQPANNFLSTNLIGQDVTNRRDDKVVGTVDEILFDQEGQIGAVIIQTGGLMGLGKKDVAIAWDQIERNLDGEEVKLSVDLTEASLAEAPGFDRK